MENKTKKLFVLFEGLNFGGQQLYIHNILRALKASNSNLSINIGYLFNESTELVSDFNLFCDSVNHCKIHSRSKWRLIARPIESIFDFISVYRYIEKKSPDVIFSNSIYSFFCCSFFKFFNRRVSHFRMIGCDLKRNESFLHSKLFLFFIPLYDYTDKILGGPLSLEYYRPLGINSNKIVLDYKPLATVDADLFKPINEQERLDLRSYYGIINVDFTIGWVGRISDDKEIWETIKVCSHIKKNYPFIKFKFVVIGDGWKRFLLEELIKEHALSNEYLRLDPVPQEDLVKLYSLIDFELLLDDDPYGGSHLREAMSCERIVISVNGESSLQSGLIEDGVTGFLVSPINRIVSAAELIIENFPKKEKLSRIGKNARLFIKDNSYEKLADIIMREIYIK